MFIYNKNWWLCLVPTSTTRFTSDLGYSMAKSLIGLRTSSDLSFWVFSCKLTVLQRYSTVTTIKFKQCSPTKHDFAYGMTKTEVKYAQASYGMSFVRIQVKIDRAIRAPHCIYKQRFLTPGHQGWNDLHRLCQIGMEYYLPNNDNNSNNSSSNNNNNNNDNNNNNKTMMMRIIIIIRMMTMMIIGTTTIMIIIIIITTTLTMTIMKMIMIKTAQTPSQSLYKDRRIQNKIAWYNWYNRDDAMLILYEMLHTCSIMHTQWRCKFENTKHRCLGMFLHKCNLHCSGRN